MKTFIRALYQSFYSGPFYAEVAHRMKGGGVLYLFFISVLYSIFASYVYFQAFNVLEKDFVPQLVEQLPAVEFKDGKLSIDKPVPYIITLGEKNEKKKLYIVVDTRPTKRSLDEVSEWMKKEKVLLLVTETNMVVYNEEKHKIEAFDLKEIKENGSITRADWQKLAETFVRYINMFLYIFIFIGVVLGHWIILIIEVFFLALIGMLIQWPLKLKLDFSALRRVGSAAITPYALFASAPISGWLWLAITLGYYTYGLWSAKAALKEGSS